MRLSTLIPLTAVLAAGCAPPRNTLFQWAANATASSSSSPPQSTDFGPTQAIGPHHVMSCGDSPAAWAPAVGNSTSLDYLELTYSQPVFVTRVQAFETWNPGAIVLIDVRDSTGVLPPLALWQDSLGDGTNAPCPGAFVIDLNGTSTTDQYDMVRVTIQGSLASSSATVFPEIDAVSLEGFP